MYTFKENRITFFQEKYFLHFPSETEAHFKKLEIIFMQKMDGSVASGHENI